MRKRNPHKGGQQETRPYFDAHAVKAAIPPKAFYRHELPDMPSPKRDGWVDGGLCPFHTDDNRGNFRVNTDTGRYWCFACGAKGLSVIDFVMERDGLSFPDALRHLGEAWGVGHE